LDSPCLAPEDVKGSSVVLGGGLAGLSAGYALTRAGRKTVLFEAGAEVGGLSRTLETPHGLRYDIGGHRFFTTKVEVERLVRDLLRDELATVNRKSTIFMRGRFFDYPLRPGNAVFGLGLTTVLRILADYASLKVRPRNGEAVTLEDWVVGRFGRTMFNLYFKEYSEKVWGLDCSRISQRWVSQRIRGLSLGTALKSAFFRFTGKEIPTLADAFLYPALGIGRIAERFSEEIEGEGKNTVLTDAAVSAIRHGDSLITGLEVTNCANTCQVEGRDYISTIPLNVFVGMMEPQPPPEVLRAARSLRYRDLITVAVTVDRESVTDQTWVYIPEQKYPFGRLHEPKAWSRKMAPEGQTLVVVEYFCTRGDYIWEAGDEALSVMTVEGMEELGFLRAEEISATEVRRHPKAYPLFEVGYEEHCETIYRYLRNFRNLRVAGRSGLFEYQNMDHAIESGMEAAGALLAAERVR
jgi:protoporphyrinogen oxidase